MNIPRSAQRRSPPSFVSVNKYSDEQEGANRDPDGEEKLGLDPPTVTGIATVSGNRASALASLYTLIEGRLLGVRYKKTSISFSFFF